MKITTKWQQQLLIFIGMILPFCLFGQSGGEQVPVLQSPFWYFGIFYGIIIFNLLVSVVQYFMSRDKAYLYYFIFILFNFLYFLHYYEYYGEEKIFFNLFFPETSPSLRISFLLLGYVMYYYFAFEFLKLSEKDEKIQKRIKLLPLLILGVLFIYLFGYHVVGWKDETATFTKYKWIHDFTILSVSIIGIYGIYIVCRIKTALTNVLILGVSLYFLGSFFGFILTISTDFASPLLQKYPLLPTQVGFIFEVIFFAIGLAYRAYLFEKEKDATNEKYIQQLRENQQLELERQDAMRYKELNDFKSRLYTNITHEFRTPLTVIMGMAEQMEENPKIKIHSRLQTIHRNSSQLLNLVNQLLDLSRLEEGSLKPNYNQGKIIPFLKYLTESYQSFARSKQRSLAFYSEVEDGFFMDFDEERMQQILENLLSNAIKFTPELGQIMVVVKKEPALNSLLIEVQDTGYGIPKEALPKIFDRFYQVENTPTKNIGGTGIGLALVKELTEILEGEVTVKSELGKGTTFNLYFPITNNEPLKNEILDVIPRLIDKHSISKTDLENGVPKGDQPLILIIEDNQDVAEYLQSCLTPHYQFIIAQNGKIGVELATKEIPDIIISDVMMPEMDGFEVCENLKNDVRTNHIPIILLTAKSTFEDRLKGLSKGADAYLNKPFKKAELFVRLKQLIAVRKNILEKNNPEIVEKPKDEFIQKFYKVVLENMENEDFDVPRLCKALGMSRTQIHRKTKALTDYSTTQLMRIIRLKEAKKMLENDSLNVSEVAYKVGYKNPANFSTHFKSQFGYSPKETYK